MQTNNIFNNNRYSFSIKINYDEYWDFFLNQENNIPYSYNPSSLYDMCLISYMDFDKEECKGDKKVLSLPNYKWEYAVSNGITFYNIGYTGVDNGLIRFRKDRISNMDFVKIYSESDITFEKDDYRLTLYEVSGNTLQYEYPLTVLDDCIKFNGGFYQGAFKTDCKDYQILPSVGDCGDVWHLEFVLKKTEFERESDKTLNDSHPNNKGFFFYLGTRAENKWIYLYDKSYQESSKTDALEDIVDTDMECSSDELSRFSNVEPTDDLDYSYIKFITPSMDDYLSYKYYSSDRYSQGQEINFLDTFVDTPTYPIIIKEDEDYIELEDCCKYGLDCTTKTKETIFITKRQCFCCGDCREISYPVDIVTESHRCCSDRYKIDEYLSDADEVFDWYGDTDYFAEEPDITLWDFQTFIDGISIYKKGRYTKVVTDNKFLLFHRAKDGMNVRNWIVDSFVEYRFLNTKIKGNLFLLMNRTKTGYTVDTIEELIEESVADYNIYEDIYNNALGFRITDKGEIGYRFLTNNCDIEDDNKIEVIEGYSSENVIKEDVWYVINVRITFGATTMFFMFYVDGKLKYITKEIPKFNLRILKEEKEKQELVPFNISLGGGTQGLCETILPNYMKNYIYKFPIEDSFAGTFIGYIKKFRFYNCFMEHLNIKQNYNFDKIK